MTKYTLNHKGVVFFFYILVVLLGINAINTIPKQENPKFPTWNAVIVTRFPGAAPLKMEELITEKIEQKMKEISDLEEITSTSTTGVSYVFLTVDEAVYDTKPVFDKVGEKLDDLQGTLPSGASIPWLNSDFGKSKSIVAAVTGDGFSNRELIEIAENVKKELGRMEHVSRVDVIGEQRQQIFLEFSNTRMAELGMNPQLMANILFEQNILQPGGEVRVGPKSVRIEATGEFQKVEDIADTIVNLPGSNTSFFIKDLFTLRRTYVDPPEMEMRFMGQDAVGIVVEMVDGGQILTLGKNVRKFLREKEQEQYLGVEFHILNYQPKWVQLKIDNFITNLWQAVLIVGIAMILMLGWREGFIISSLIPFSFLIAVILMQWFDIPIHQISIASLIIALGMLVDNGIVMTENIGIYIREGMSKTEAAIRSGKELTIPLLVATATTVTAFLPVATARSAVGLFCNSIAWVVGFVLLASFFVSMTMVPMLCEKLLKPKVEKKPSRIVQKTSGLYEKTLRFCLRFKYATVIAVVVVFAGTIQLMGLLDFVFFPPSDRAQFLIDFRLPEGTDYNKTKAEVLKAEKDILSRYGEQIKSMAIYIGEGGPRFQAGVTGDQRAANYAQFVVNNGNFSETRQMVDELPRYFSDNFVDAEATVKMLDSGPAVGAPLKIQVYGKDLDRLYAYAKRIEEMMVGIRGTRNVRNDWGDLIPKIRVNVHQDQARRVGVSTRDISYSLSTAFSGYRTTEYREGDKTIPIIMRSVGEERSSLNFLKNISLNTGRGASVPLLQIANINLAWETGKIRHLNRRRTITVESYLVGSRTAADILNELKAKIESIPFETGYGVTFSGEEDASRKANDSIMIQLPLALALMVMILVAQFSNVRKRVIILMTIPLSFLGIVLGLLATGYSFGFLALLGVISLAGIVVNNAILLLEQVQLNLEAGIAPIEAIVQSGKRRAFPILLTTITTSVGLYPLAISGDFWGPMAVTIMGGLVVSAGLTLVVIPVLYAIFFGVRYKAA